MSCITKLLELKGDKEILPVHAEVVIEGGGHYKGFEYLITFTSNGHRCGYVAVPDNFGNFIHDISCHGGVTFEDENHSAKDLLPVHCKDTWIGFDCAHWGDIADRDTAKKYFAYDERQCRKIDEMIKIHEEILEMELRDPNCSHKDYAFVEEECKSIIEQFIELAA